jgi:hypothetical protein
MANRKTRKGVTRVVSLSAFHAVTVELHSGMLALAAFCIVLMLFAAFYKRTFKNRGKKFGGFLKKASVYAEPTAYLAAIGGVIGMILSSITGYLIVAGMYNTPSEALINSPPTMNKIMVSMIALELWIAFVVVRSWYGKRMWNIKSLAATYLFIGVIAFGFTMIAGSMGGHMTGKGSILDPMLQFLGISYNNTWVVSMDAAFLLLAAVNIFVVASVIFYVYMSRSAKKKSVKN